jgi:DNA (cytosine-5)-methyltransferase 1
MTHGSLFSGIGGFDLAAQWMGWENVFHVERDPFCRQVLTHHFPKSQSFDDVKTFDATPFRGRLRVLSGGFPCQPFSAAGKRAGTSDDRYLWPEMFRIIREARPTYVVAENVRGLLSWNEGLVLDTVCADLEGEGYEVCPVVLPAASVNAPHRRDRIWIVAHTKKTDSKQPVHTRSGGVGFTGSIITHAHDKGGAGGPRQVQGANGEVPERDDDAQPRHASTADAPNACGMGREWGRGEKAKGREGQRFRLQLDAEGQSSGADASHAVSDERPKRRRDSNRSKEAAGYLGLCDAQSRTWQNFPSFAPICGGDDGLPERLDGITFSKWRRESIKAYGNAIVPQVALQIFRAIEGKL